MHAPPDRRPGIRLGKRGAVALLTSLAAALAGCSAAATDPSALSTPGPSAVPAGPPAPAQAVTVSGAVPQIAGHPAAAVAFGRAAAPCAPTVERNDQKVVSVFWHCASHRVAAATFGLAANRLLTLGDLLTGSYQQYLSSVASDQFAAQGMPGARTSDLSTWFLTPVTLDVVFPAGVITFPLASLSPYRNPGAPL